MLYTGAVPKVDPSFTIPVPAYMKPNGHWTFNGQMGEGVGFVYVIFDLYLKRAYLGRKSYVQKKGVRTTESDWKTYKGSSNILALHTNTRPDDFRFYCLGQYKTKSGLNWAESWSLTHARIPFTTIWYNEIIPEVSHRTKEDVTPAHVASLEAIMKLLGYDEVQRRYR